MEASTRQGQGDSRPPTPQEQVRRLYEEAESRTAQAFEEVVGRESFGQLLARITDNAMALTRVSTTLFDLALRNLRLAGRSDVVELAKQLGRTEDKLELVLQEVERLQQQLAEAEAGRRDAPGGRAEANGGGGDVPPGP
jgi:uncharacterized coiled-coil protein SlyX